MSLASFYFLVFYGDLMQCKTLLSLPSNLEQSQCYQSRFDAGDPGRFRICCKDYLGCPADKYGYVKLNYVCDKNIYIIFYLVIKSA